MPFEEAMQAFEELDDFDAKGYARIYNKYFEENLDERFFLFQNSPDGQAFQNMEAVISDEPIEIDFDKDEEKVQVEY